jgi:NADPH:quinone reductase-like Zn-dependent oxidoreductase
MLEKNLMSKPENLSFEQAGAVQIAGLTALQGLRDAGKLQAGEKVLINGASGGVGTFAVQIAKTLGAHVTGVCSTRNVVLVRSLGADQVIDYTKEDFTNGAERYDLILDMVGNKGLLECRRALKPDGRYIMIGGPKGRWVAPMDTIVRAFLLKPFIKQEMSFMMSEVKRDDLLVLRDLMQSGKVTPVIDKSYPLNQTSEAVAYVETGRARGKVVITVDGQPSVATR